MSHNNGNDNNDRAMLAALQAKIAELEAANKTLQTQAKSSGTRELSFKVGEKGGVSVYGMGRFPVSLYVEQWERLFTALPKLQAFIEANRGVLTTKASKVAATVTAPNGAAVTA